MKDKKGNKLTFKEYMIRWGKGIEGITPLQQVKTELFATRMILLGLIFGIIVSIYAWKNLWWVLVILLGALVNTSVGYLAQRQKYKFLLNMEEVK